VYAVVHASSFFVFFSIIM